MRSPAKSSLLPPETEICVVGDIGPHTDWSGALNSVDTIIHLASRVHVMQETSSDPLSEYRRVNVSGTKGLANVAGKAGVRRMIFLSTVNTTSNNFLGDKR